MENDFFRYERTGEIIEGGIAGDFLLEVLAEEVRPEDAKSYTEAREKNRKKGDRRYRLKATGNNQETAALGSLFLVLALVATGTVIGFRKDRAI